MISYFGLFDWIFIIYFFVFKLKLFAYAYVNHNGDTVD